MLVKYNNNMTVQLTNYTLTVLIEYCFMLINFINLQSGEYTVCVCLSVSEWECVCVRS